MKFFVELDLRFTSLASIGNMEFRILILSALVAAGSAAPLSSTQCARQCDGVQPFESQKTYQYSYSVETASYVNDSNTEDLPRDASVLKITCNVEVVAQSSCEIFLRVVDVDVKERSNTGREVTSPKENDIKRDLEAHWLRYAFQDGVVKEVCPEEGEMKFALNFKRGIMSALQSPVPQIPQDVKQPMMNVESDVTGTCPAYLASSLTGGIYKTKDFEGCKDRTMLEGAIQAVKLTPYAPLFSVIESTQECFHNTRSPFLVSTSSCTERHLVRPFSKHETGVVTVIQQELRFVEMRDGGSAPSSYMQERITNILFEHPDMMYQADPQDAKNMIFSYCRSFEEDNKQLERPEYFSQLIDNLNNINDQGFTSVRQYATDANTCRGKVQLKKFFIDAVAMCESVACINGMASMLAEQDLVKPSVAEMWISSLPFIQKPKSEMIPTLMNIVKVEPIQPQVYLAVSSLIHNFCNQEGVDCSTDSNFINALKYFETSLNYDCSPSGEMNNNQRLKLIVSLKAIGNVGNIGNANALLGTLTRCMQRTSDIDIRLAAIEAFRRLPCETEERVELTNLYKNTVEDTELRSASFRAMMQCLNEDILQVVVDTMDIEADEQVGSFVMSYIKNLNESNDPQKKDAQQVLLQSEIMRTFSRDIRKMSRNYEVSYFNDKMMTGATLEGNVIFSKKSFLPRSVSLNTTTEIFGYAINVFEIGGRMEGMQHMLESFFGPTGYFKEDSTTLMQTLMGVMGVQMPPMPPMQGQQGIRNKRNVDQSRVDNIVENVKSSRFTEEDKPMASVYMKMFGNEIGFMDYDAIVEKFNQWKQSANFMQVLGRLATEQTIDISRSNKMLKVSLCIPTVAGLPLKLSVDGNSVTEISASGKLDILGAMMAPRSLTIEGSIKPSVAVELSTTLTICAHHTKAGLNHVARLHSDSILDGAIIIEDGSSMRVKLNVPEEKQTIVDVSSRLFRLSQQDKVEITNDPSTTYSREICTAELTAKYLGVRVCTDMTFPTVFTTPGSPSMLLAGESQIKMTLNKVDPHLTSFEMDITRRTDKNMVNGEVALTDVFRLMVGTPNTRVERTYQIDYSMNHDTNQMLLSMTSPFKTVNIDANTIREELHKKLDLHLRIDPNTQTEKAFRLILEQEIEMPSEGIIRYVPRFEFTGPKGNNMQLTGSIINNEEQRRTDIDIQVQENSQQVVSINGPITSVEGTKKSVYGIEMTVDGRYLQGKLSGSVNRNKEAYTMSMDWKNKVSGQLETTPWASTSVIYGSNREDVMYRLENEVEFTTSPEWNYHFEIESEGTPLNHENTVKLCYNGISCDTDTKVVFVQNNTAMMSPDGTEATQSMNIRFNHPAQNKQYEMMENFKWRTDKGFNWTVSVLDQKAEGANRQLVSTEIMLLKEPKGMFRIEMVHPTKYWSVHNDWHHHDTGRFDLVCTIMESRELTSTITFAYAPSMNMVDVDLDIVLEDAREINIGSRWDNNIEQGMVDYDFTIDKFGVQNWVAINVDYRDTSDDTKWEHRGSIDIQTPLVTLQNKRIEGGVKKTANIVTSDVFVRYNPTQPKVGVEFIFTNNSNEYDTHGQVELIFTTRTHSISVTSAGGYQMKTDERVCNLLASVNLLGLEEQGEGKTFGFEVNYSDGTSQSRIRHSLDARGYAPDHEVKMDTFFKLEPDTYNLASSFDLKWVKEQQGLTVTVDLVNSSDQENRRIAITSEVTLPEQNLVVNINHNRREGYYDRSLIVTLNNEERANVMFTYTKALQGPMSICSPNLNILINGKRVIVDATIRRYGEIIQHLDTSITHNQDSSPSFSVVLDITPVDQTDPQAGIDLTFTVVNAYMTGYDTTLTLSQQATPPSMTNNVILTVDSVQKLVVSVTQTQEEPERHLLSMMNRGQMDLEIHTYNIDVSFPDMPVGVINNLETELRFRYNRMSDRQLTFKWGDKAADKTITILQTTSMNSQTAGAIITSVTHPFVLPSIYPTFSIGVHGAIDTPLSRVKVELTTADNKKKSIKVIYTNTSNTAPIKQAAEIILARTDKDDISFKGELKALTPEAIADLTITCIYSALVNEHLTINTKLVNRSDGTLERQGKEVELHVYHPVGNFEIDMFLTSNNDTRDISVGLEGTVRVGTEQGAITLEASWDKRNKQYRLHQVRESLQSARTLERTTNEFTFTGTFEDKSYGDYNIYEVDMMNEFNGERIPSFFKFDGRDQQVEYDINFNPADRNDYARFNIGYLNSSAISAKIDTRRGLSHTVNASVLLYLQGPKVLYTQINWHPQWPQDLQCSALDMWNNTVERFQAREHIRFYHNQAMTNMMAQWEIFKGRNVDVKTNALQFIGALQAKIGPAAITWNIRKQNAQGKWTTFKTDVATAVLPYIMQANATWQARKANFPVVVQNIKTGVNNYFVAAGQALEMYKAHCILPVIGGAMMNIQQLNASLRTDVQNIMMQTATRVADMKLTYNKTIERLQLDAVIVGVQMITVFKEVNTSVQAAFAERFVAMRQTLERNPILVDFIRWTILAKELVPVQQWNETLRALYTEFATSNDLQAIREFMGDLMQLRHQGQIAWAEYCAANPRNSTMDYTYLLKALEHLGESQQNYKLVKADIENGEIIVLLYLNEEWKNLQELPEAFSQNTADELKKQLVGMAPLVQNQVRTQIMDPQLQRIGMYEAANLLNILNSNMSVDALSQLSYQKGLSKYWRGMHFLNNMLRNPRSMIPPYDATAMIVHDQHYMTFDRRFYEFAGRCTYLLAQDFLNGNFSVYVDYSESDADMTTKTLIVQQDGQSWTIYPDLTVTDGNRIKDLPFRIGNITITREHNRVKVHNDMGVSVECTTPYEICHVSMSGWYFDQTAGLLGTYDYQAKNDFTLPNNEVTDTIDRFTRNWEVSTACSTTTNRADKCTDVDPASEQNRLCQNAFLDTTSPFRPLFDVVDPEPFYKMCVNDMCGLTTEAERMEHVCESYKAYLSQRTDFPIAMPSHCIKCQTSNGTIISPEKPVKVVDPVAEADVVFIVEEKRCAEGVIADKLHDIVIRLDTELRRNNISNNRFALVGFGGEDVHDLPHPHTIDGALFNQATKFRLGVDALEFADDGSTDTLAAILRAANYPFRAGVSKNIVLISCSECQYKETSYSAVADVLIKRGIQLNMLISHELKGKTEKKNKSSKEMIYGYDELAVYTSKMAGQPTLVGDQSLRKFVNEPLNKCSILAMETNGSVFNVDEINRKAWQEVFVLRMVKYSQPMPCQICKCVPNSDWVGESVCERCEAVTPTEALIQALRINMGEMLIKPNSQAAYMYTQW